MSDTYVKGMPVVLPYLKESVQSWLVRYCLNTGMEPIEVFNYLQVTRAECADGYFTQSTKNQMEQVLGYECKNFELNVIVSRNIHSSDVARRLIQKLTTNQGVRFRFCPKCLAQDRVPYFRIDWSFEFVRYCFDHNCLYEAGCPRCQGELYLPFAPFRTSKKRSAVGSLMECYLCGNLLFDCEPIGIFNSVEECPLKPAEQVHLQAGMATMACMVYGYGLESYSGKKISMSSVGELISEGAVPNSSSVTDATTVRQRDAHRVGSFEINAGFHTSTFGFGWR